MSSQPKKLTAKQTSRALFDVAKTTFKIAPGMVLLQIIGSAVTAGLPILTTYFAALTTTSLAEAYAGVDGAGERVLWLVAATAVIGAAQMAWSTFENYYSQLMRFQLETVMTDRLYERFHMLEFWRYDDKNTVDTYDRARRVTIFFSSIFQMMAGLAVNVLTMLISLWLLLAANVWLALITAAATVPSLMIQLKLTRMNNQHWRQNVETRRRAAMIEFDMFRPENMAELRLYGVIRQLLDIRTRLREKDEKARIQFERKFMFWRLGANVVTASAEVVSLVWVTLEIVGRHQPIGNFVLVQQLVSRTISSVESLVSSINNFDEELASLSDYQQFLQLPTINKNQPKLPKLAEEISFQNVSFAYPKSKTEALRDINLTIKRGQHIALVGENGAGKTTLIKLLTGLYAPTSGTVSVDGHNLAKHDVESWHRQLAVLSQQFILYAFATANENVWFGDVSRSADQAAIDKALADAEAANFVSKLDKKGETYVSKWMESDDGTKGVELSSGQQQRLALARNFYRDSPVIILDEPTSAIDALAETRIFDHLFKSNKTIITVSHRLSTIAKADMIVMLDDGEIVEQGTHQGLIKRRGTYYQMFKSQLNGTH